MKNLLAVLLSMALIFAFTACNNGENEASEEVKPSESVAEKQESFLLSNDEAVEAVKERELFWPGDGELSSAGVKNVDGKDYNVVSLDNEKGHIAEIYLDENRDFFIMYEDKLAKIGFSTDNFEIAELYEKAFYIEKGLNIGWSDFDYEDHIVNEKGWGFGLNTFPEFSNIDELKAYLNSIFSKELAERLFNENEQKFLEKDGKLYISDGARGSNIVYRFTAYILLEENENSIKYQQIPFYYDCYDETGKPFFIDESLDSLSFIKEDGTWKVSEFMLQM